MFQPKKAPGFMKELDQWVEESVIGNLVGTRPTDLNYEEITARVKRAIREKVLESYHNGQAAGPAKGRRNDTR